MRSFRRVYPADRQLKQLEDNAAEAFGALQVLPLLDGRLVADVDLTTSSLRVEHGLGRTARGYIVVRSDAAQTVYETAAPDASYVYLRASGTVTVSLWVF